MPAGETVLRWDRASAVAESDDTTNVEKIRSALDEAIDFRGNVYSQSVSHCCIGCATWQKCFNLAPRLSLSLVLTALFFAYVPWAFPSFLELIKGGGSIVKMITGSASVGFAAAALLVQVRALGRATAFLSKYSEKVPALKPLEAMRRRKDTDALWKLLFSTAWDPLM
ncbi:hypothetical protein Ndes2526B_g06242 [Nannochloris sp. 'desiccata']|nr:hypothetical protein KSW81_008019 [Chlorella desiccata (nom. nud.)]KAH7619279.1 hypothetical protein NADE_006123 [Chlorella desiccata (nom. nud.)]